MKIKALNITAYGKLKNNQIKLEEGLNIFYGANESGKTTIKNFILDMIFGGTVPGSKIARYTAEHESYKPWSGYKFEGSMLISYKGSDYHLHRNFNKGNETFSIRDIETGEDSKDTFNVDTTRKVETIDERFFGITESNLRNTFLIDNKEDKDSTIGPDLRDRMINSISTHREDLSIRDILNKIDDTYLSNNHNKAKRVLKKDIETIKTELKYLPDIYQYEESIDEIDRLNKKIKELTIQIEDQEMATMDRIIIDNPQYIESLMYQQERLVDRSDKLEYEQGELEITLNKLLKFRPVIFFTIVVAIIIGMYFKVYYLVLSVLIIGVIETYKNTLIDKIDNLDREIKYIYSNLDNILEKANKYQQDSIGEENPEIIKLKNDLKALQYDRERLLERARITDLNIKKEMELREKLNVLKTKEEELLFLEEMANTAKEIIEKMSKDNFSDVSDKLVRIASENINFITFGKYSRLLISDTGTITLYDTDINNYVDIEDLSRGTLEQVYLSYRIALIASLGIDFPIMLDDSFAFYDEDRRDRTLTLLSQISKHRQIMYFTSSKRDLEYLQKINNNNIIYLGE